MCEYFVKADPIQYEQRTRSVRIRGMLTSIRLENMVWDVLAEMAEALAVKSKALGWLRQAVTAREIASIAETVSAEVSAP